MLAIQSTLEKHNAQLTDIFIYYGTTCCLMRAPRYVLRAPCCVLRAACMLPAALH